MTLFNLQREKAFTGAEPLGVWLHREMLVLVCTHDFERTNASSTLSHLSNGLLNRRLNHGDVPECEGCAYNATQQVFLFSCLLLRISFVYSPLFLALRELEKLLLCKI